MTASATCAFDPISLRSAITDTYEYDAYGNALISTGSTPNVYLYRGEQYDSDLGLYYLRARYYNPLTGRFMSRDPNEPKLRGPDGTPIDPIKLHKYLYAGGDPVNRIDPTGREELGEEGYADSLIAAARPFAEEAVRKGEVYALCRGIAVIWTAENPDFTPDELTLYYAACVATLGGNW